MFNCLDDITDFEGLYKARWKTCFDNKKPPEKYVENYVSCGMDYSRAPGLTDFVLHGFSYDEAVRMRKLLYIEHLRYSLFLKEKECTYTPQELSDFAMSISERIKEYNEKA